MLDTDICKEGTWLHFIRNQCRWQAFFCFFCQGLEGDKTMQLAIADPDRYVLKPQLEGGGEMNTVFLVCFFLVTLLRTNTRHSWWQQHQVWVGGVGGLFELVIANVYLASLELLSIVSNCRPYLSHFGPKVSIIPFFLSKTPICHFIISKVRKIRMPF